MNKNKIIVIVGPTGVGKTKLSIELAKKYNAEIINADSTQVYKYANIGTAKVTEEEQEGIPHHLLNILELNEPFTIYDFQKQGRKILNELINQNKNVIIVGGSGLYIKALLYDYKLSDEVNNFNNYDNLLNKELKDLADKISIENNIHINNRQRLIRYINKYNNSNDVIVNDKGKNNKIYNFITIGLTTDRENLYNIINKRVDDMFENGLLDEVKDLYKPNNKAINTMIGYKETIEYIKGNITLEEAKEEIKKNTRRYSKRQYTWYNNQMKDIKWFETNYTNFNKTITEVIQYIENINY